MQNRRDFLKSLTAAASMVGMAGAPKFSFAQEAGQKTFIKVFMRGGADGLHLFPLVGDPFYYQYRPDIAIPPPSNDINSAIDLGDPMRGMNPNLEMLMEIWDAGNMMVAPATSFDPNNRSHFDCQRWIGTGARNSRVRERRALL
ncbi:MAG: twin-arginine translocation signal domain-containing protein [Litoreibacter sp.]|nr:twin-arginine translocation signal domain-containing protein [Litoreibacter sp.]